MKPTQEQIEAARVRLRVVDDPEGPPLRLVDMADVAALRTLLAATEPATDEELDAEAVTYFRSRTGGEPPTETEADMYRAGARREGRR